MPTYKTLLTQNEEYNPALLGELEELYQGGYGILQNSGKYLTQLVGEAEDRYRERCRITSYQPFFAHVVNAFATALFGQPLDVKPAADASNPDTPGELPDPTLYHAFQKDCDKAGTTFLDLMKALLITALKKRSAIVHLDFPAPGDVEPKNKAEEDAMGSDRVYAYEVPVEQLIDWEDGKDGLVWATLHWKEIPREGPFGLRDTVVEHFKIWQMKDGVAVWRQFDVRYPVNGPVPNPEQEIPETSNGKTSFKRIPLLKLTLPIGLWTGNMIGPQCREHFQRRSSLIGSQNRSLCAIPWVALGPSIGAEGDAIPAEITQNESRGDDPVKQFKSRGYVVLGSDDKIGFAEPLGHCYELVDKQLDRLRDAIFSVASQMAASITGSSSTALGRSGLSKQKDTESTAKVLGELGSKVRQFAALVYRTISEARGEDVIWTAHGLDSYELEEREQILQEGISLDQVSIPSTTFKKHHKFQTAKKLLGVGTDPATLDQIKLEIESGVDDEVALADLMKEAQQAQVEAATAAAKNPASALGPSPVTPPQNPTVLGMQHPAPATSSVQTASGGPTGAGPAPGGATADGKVGQSEAAKDAGVIKSTSGHMHDAAIMAAKAMGPSGQPLLPDNAHHQSGAHIDAQTVFETISGDYKDKDIKWIFNAAWIGPVEVPLQSIDFSNKDNWQAAQPEDSDHVQHFVDKIEDEKFAKPCVLVNNPANDSKMVIVDGHHRALAYLQLGRPVVAYVGQVGADKGDWSDMHDNQKGSKENSSKQVSSQQSSQQSPKQKSTQRGK
jgi:hypothetical protein